MKRFTMLAAAVSVLWVAGTGLRAQEGAKAQSRPNGQGMMEKLTQELSLTPDQVTALKPIFESHIQAMENWHKEHGQEATALREKIKSGAADDATKEQMQKLRAGRDEIEQSFLKQLGGVMTSDQLEKFKKIRGQVETADRIEMLAKQLGLTPDQQSQIQNIFDDAKTQAASAKDDAARMEIQKAAMDKAKALLTPEQAKKMDELRGPGAGGPGGGGPFPMLQDIPGLTDQQKSQIRAIADDLKKQAEGASEDQRRELHHAAVQKIMDTVLTPQQAQDVKKKMAEHQGAGAPPPPSGAGSQPAK